MKVLSLSDIHAPLSRIELLVEKMRERASIDLIIIAGDIGSIKASKKILFELTKIQEKIFYVQGNWDDYPYETKLTSRSKHIHLNHETINGWCFLGYSGSEANLYRGNKSLDNSFEFYNNNKKTLKKEFETYYQYRRNIIFNELLQYIEKNDIDIDDLVLVTHDRLYKLPFMPFLYVFGHVHNPKYTYYRGVHFLNTSFVKKDTFFNEEGKIIFNYCIIDFDQYVKVRFNDLTCRDNYMY